MERSRADSDRTGKRNGRFAPLLCAAQAFLAFWLISLSGQAPAQEMTAPEYHLKAVFLYNFAALTEWPSNTFSTADSPLTIGILGKDPFGSALQEVAKKPVNGRKIRILAFQDPVDVSGCQLLFISDSEKDRLPAVLARLSGQPILTVSDIDQFADNGGMIGLLKRKDRIRFEVNLDAARRARLTLSSRLLALGKVIGVPPGPNPRN
jgi:YfiR/HmsC-like